MQYPQSGEVNRLVKKIKGVNSLSELFSSDSSTEEVVNLSNEVGEFLARRVRLKASQLRKVFDNLKKIESEVKKGSLKSSDIRKRIILLKPMLAYTVARHPNTVGPLADILQPAIDKVRTEDDFKTLVQLLETILAYHKFHGGRD